MVTRSIDVFDPGIVTIGRITAGTTTNVIPETAVIEGTMRAVSAATRRGLHDGVRRVAEGIAAAHGCDRRGASCGRGLRRHGERCRRRRHGAVGGDDVLGPGHDRSCSRLPRWVPRTSATSSIECRGRCCSSAARRTIATTHRATNHSNRGPPRRRGAAGRCGAARRPRAAPPHRLRRCCNPRTVATRNAQMSWAVPSSS